MRTALLMMLLAGVSVSAQGQELEQPSKWYIDQGYAHVFHAECFNNRRGSMVCLDAYQKGDHRVVCELMYAVSTKDIEVDRCWVGKDPRGRWTE